MDITDGVAVVTGGASGLGLATAHKLADAGAHVVLLDLPRTDADDVVAGFDGRATYAEADVTDEDQVRAAFELAGEIGPVRVVVNCAGIGTPARVLSRDNSPVDLAAFVRIVTVNLIGTFNVLRLGAERMMRSEPVGEERGVIVNTASVAAFDGQVGQAAYSASKGGIVGMTLPIARDLADRLIRVVTVAPGTFDTPLLGTLPENIRQSLGAQVPHPSRLGQPEEFGALVAHIVANPMLNGEVIRLDGAIRMAPR
ncbi:MAG: putative short-chain type dehydrogenase/reductase [Blastococcus sp.]|nr:putative short-chain type dehydrogenase/reductase [Blastococcus sp.]